MQVYVFKTSPLAVNDKPVILSDGCMIPDILQSANWDYDFDSTTATLYFTSSGMTGLSFTARGEVLMTYTCIANTNDVYVFK
jgi:hypothetical protein